MKHFLFYLLLTISFLTAFPETSHAQKSKYEFEKIGPADFTVPPLSDSSAAAYVIADCGTTKFDYGQNGFYLIFSRKARIHILKPEGYEYATVIIPLYKSLDGDEKIFGLKASTYNLENGKVERTKLRSEDEFRENESERWDNHRFTLPNVKPGSIIEFEYEVHSLYLFNLQSWTFQMGIPVKWSEYEVRIPEYFDYKKIFQGYNSFFLNESGSHIQRITVPVERTREVVGRSVYSSTGPSQEMMDFTCYTNHWVIRDAPAFKSEPYMTTVKDHVNKIEFELSVIRMPQRPINNVMDTWETLNKKLMDDDKLGKLVKKGNFFTDKLPFLIHDSLSQEEKIRKIYAHAAKHASWNGKKRIFAEKKPSKTYEDRTGDAAEINLMLVAMLNEAGFKAYPVILSTRDHGQIQPLYPILAKFNYLVACVKLDSKQYLLDATSQFIPFNTLPERCLNGKGILLKEEGYEWITLLSQEIANTYTNAQLTLSEEGVLSGTIAQNTMGINATHRRASYNNTEQKAFIEAFAKDRSGWQVSDFMIENEKDPDKPLIETYTLEITDAAQVAGDRIYLNTFGGIGIRENPFRLASRLFPVDFSCPQKVTELVTIQVPEGWVVESMPQPTLMSLPEKAGTFRFTAAQNGNTISISCNFNINKVVFSSAEYEALKEFYRLVVSKHTDQLVLKKA